MASRRKGKRVKSGLTSPPPARTGIGVRLRAARELRGWTREALAYHAGVSWAAIAQIESGRRTDVRLNTLAALASALGVSVDHLMGDGKAVSPLQHRVMIYRTQEEFLRGTVPFLLEGHQRGYGLIAAMAQGKIEALRSELGPAAREVIIASDSWDRDSPATLESLVDERIEHGHGWVHVIGEPIWTGRSPEELRRWVRYEALINIALADSRATIVCAYDARSLPAPIVNAGRRTHPETHPSGRPSARYREASELLLLPDEQLV